MVSLARSSIKLRKQSATAAFLVVATLAASTARAHEVPHGYIQHDLYVSCDRAMIDVELTLIFHEQASSIERRAMDQNNDGRVDSREVRIYRAKILSQARASVHLMIDGFDAHLIPLYPPDVDLIEPTNGDYSMHKLTLYFFARFPNDDPSGALLEVTDGLWPEFPVIGSVSTKADDGILLQTLPAWDPSTSPNRTVEPLLFRARFIEIEP